MNSIGPILGYTFRHARLLEEALTHPSCAKAHNGIPYNYQRLEFLGDAVLGMVIAELLFKRYPQEEEGSLAKRQAALVRSESLAGIARALKIGDFIHMAVGEQNNTGRENNANLEDVCEALIGAMYLDGGLEPVKAFILKHWEPLARAASAPPKDAKTTLQEWAQGRGLPLPDYKVIETVGPAHAPEFTIEVSVEGGHAARAKATSKRQAEQLAAKGLMQRLGEI